MRDHCVRMLGYAAVACLLASPAGSAQQAPESGVAALDSLRLPSGAILRVWEARTEPASESRSGASWHLAYDLTGVSGSVGGIVPGTEDAAPDRSPRLSADSSGRSVTLVWSRWDGVFQKIAYSRFEHGAWVDTHDLTFGRGDDVEPRIGRYRDGAFLFWISGSEYMAAPLEPRSGRLLAAPSALRLPGAGRPSFGAGDGDSDSVGRRTGEPSLGGSGVGILDPGSGVVNGGVDTPIHQKQKPPPASVWGVGSDDHCRRMTVVTRDTAGTHLLIYRFTNGGTTLIRTIDLPSPPPPRYADAEAASALRNACN